MGRRCRRFVTRACSLVCFVEVEDSCSVKGFRRRIGGVVAARIDCSEEVGLVLGTEDSADHKWDHVRFAVKEDRHGSAGCRLGWKLGSWRRNRKEGLGRIGLVGHNCLEANCIAQRPDWRRMCLVDRSYHGTAFDGYCDHDAQGTIGSVVGRKDSAKPESAAHMRARLIRIGCSDYFVKSRYTLEHYRRLIVQALPALRAYAVNQQIHVVLRPGMRLVVLEMSNYHCCSILHVVAVVAWSGVVHRQIHADRAPDMMPVGLGLNNHRCLSFVLRMSTRNYYSGSAKSIRLQNISTDSQGLPKSRDDPQGSS